LEGSSGFSNFHHAEMVKVFILSAESRCDILVLKEVAKGKF
jgi:hypothetical protein